MRTVGRLAALAFLTLALPGDARSQTFQMHIVDVGAGLCVVASAPASDRSRVMVYDANSGCQDGLEAFTAQDTIDLLVISHSDADHLRDADDLLRDRPVKVVLRTGSRRDGTNYGRMEDRIGDETKEPRATVINLATFPLEPGFQFGLGDATVTFIAGWPEWTATSLHGGEALNAVSLTVRVDFAGRSILLPGDTVGRLTNDPANTCAHAESVMVARSATVPLASDVLVAPHHGADNGSSTCFIQAVDPEFVIFSAGSQFGHPRDATAQRYLSHGVPLANMLRTDRGDDEDGDLGPLEWKHLSVDDCQDEKGDDTVVIVIEAGGSMSVNYQDPPPSTGC